MGENVIEKEQAREELNRLWNELQKLSNVYSNNLKAANEISKKYNGCNKRAWSTVDRENYQQYETVASMAEIYGRDWLRAYKEKEADFEKAYGHSWKCYSLRKGDKRQKTINARTKDFVELVSEGYFKENYSFVRRVSSFLETAGAALICFAAGMFLIWYILPADWPIWEFALIGFGMTLTGLVVEWKSNITWKQIFCKHKWVQVGVRHTFVSTGLIANTHYQMVCKKCGKRFETEHRNFDFEVAENPTSNLQEEELRRMLNGTWWVKNK